MAGAAPQDAKSSSIKMLGGFELITKVGRGGMGAVYKARQVSLDRTVAVKVLPPSLAKSNPLVIERFFREARTCAKLNHPNIVQGVEVGRDDKTGLYYFAMEFIDGPTVNSLLKDHQPIPEERAIEIVKQVTEALICAHHAGIIHRDIKPDNILLTSKGEVKLADLGLARGLLDTSLEDVDSGNQEQAVGSKLTQMGKAVGTPAYMAPEQVRGEVEALDARTDLYALGGTFFHMVVGHRPYKAKTTQETMSLQVHAPIPKVRDLNPSVSEATAAIIVRLMQKNPADRFQSAEALLRALNGEAEKSSSSASSRSRGAKTTAKRAPVSARLDAPVIDIRKPARGPNRVMGALAVAALAAIAVAAYALRPPPPARANGVSAPAMQPKWAEASPRFERVEDHRPPDLTTVAAAKNPDKREAVVAIPTSPAAPVTPAAAPAHEEKPVAVEAAAKPMVMAPPDNHVDISVKPAVEPDSTKIAAAAPPAKPEPAIQEQALARARPSLDALNIPQAVAAVKALEAEKKMTPVESAVAESSLGAAIEARANALATEADALSAKGDFDKALERLNAMVFRNTPDRSSAELEAQKLIVDLRDTLAVNKALAEMQAQVRQAGLLEPILQNVATLVQGDNVDQAAMSLDRSIARPELASIAETLKAQRQLLTWLQDVRTAIDKGAAVLVDGRAFTLNFNEGKPLRVGKPPADTQVTSAANGALTVQKKHQNPRPINFNSLTHDTKFDLSLLSCEKDKDETARLKVKWAYADLLALSPNAPKGAAALDIVERELNTAAAIDAAKGLAADVRPWLLRAQKMFRANRVRPGVAQYLSFLTVAAPEAAGAQFKIAINGKTILQGPDHAGLNLVAFDGERLLKRDTFDTAADPAAAQRFAECVNKLPRSALAIVALSGDANKLLNESIVATLGVLGASQIQRGLGKKNAYLCIGSTSLEQGAVIEEFGNALASYPH